jgi:hypothetical protein
MRTRHPLNVTILAMLILTTIGCNANENTRLAEMTERQLELQSEQNRQLHKLHSELAEGSRNLVEADAEARHELVTLQRDLQANQGEVGRQRDLLETERRALASQRQLAPIVAAAISQIGLLAACLLPLILCWYLLRQPERAGDDPAMAEFLLEDLLAHQPLLLPQQPEPRQLAFRSDGEEHSSCPD